MALIAFGNLTVVKLAQFWKVFSEIVVRFVQFDKSISLIAVSLKAPPERVVNCEPDWKVNDCTFAYWKAL